MASIGTGLELASIALRIGALKLDPNKPFKWASGYYMPIYNDNRLLLSDYKHRMIARDGFLQLLKTSNISFDTIGGVSTGGISPATTLADHLKQAFLYVRSSAKEHGTKKEVEGELKPADRVLLIEDVISTGRSAIKAVESVRKAGGEVSVCFSIFSYDFQIACDLFKSSQCSLYPLLTFTQLLEVAQEEKYLASAELDSLREWGLDPFTWGEANGHKRDGSS